MRTLQQHQTTQQTTLQTVLQEHPVKPIHLYRPQAKDWFGSTKQYLYRVRDGERRTDLLRRRAELLDAIANPDEELAHYRDEVHQKLSQAEQDMKRIRVEVMELIGQLPSVNQQMVMIKRYVDRQTWEETAADMDMSVRAVQVLHGRALPKLKQMLGLDGKAQASGAPENSTVDGKAQDGKEVNENGE